MKGFFKVLLGIIVSMGIAFTAFAIIILKFFHSLMQIRKDFMK